MDIATVFWGADAPNNKLTYLLYCMLHKEYAMNSTLENRHYVATKSDIERIARDHTASLTGQATVMRTFLQALVGTTIAELKAEPRVRSARERMKTQDAELVKTSLVALQSVYSRFYATLTEAFAKAPLDPETAPRHISGRRLTRKALVQARATKFRSAKHALQAWIKAGHDITALAPAQVTRSELVREARAGKPGSTKPAGVDRIARRAEGTAKRFVDLVREMAKLDADRAGILIAEAAGTLAAARAEVSGTPLTDSTTSIKRAAQDGMPLDVGDETFILLPYKPLEPRPSTH